MPIRPVPMQLLVSSDQFSADLYIMGDIRRGSIWDSFDETGASAERKTESLDVTKALADMPKSVQHINVHINSYGGEVAEGLAIYNALKSHRANHARQRHADDSQPLELRERDLRRTA